MQSYEVEVKALLGSPERAEGVRKAMRAADPACKMESKSKQLNHYFTGGTLKDLAKAIAPHLSGVADVRLDDLVARAKDASIRTRLLARDAQASDKNGIVYIVVKASVDDTTSQNGISRIEFEERMPLPLEALDKLVLSAGFSYQAKWSREREEYFCKGITVCLDKNAGYGWLAEFERVVDDSGKVEQARKDVRALMNELGVEELAQARLERMFAHYNAHWQEYYGTEKVFTVE